VSAPESAHASRKVIDEALRCKREGTSRSILFNLSGHGHFDLGAYEAYLAGTLEDYSYLEDDVAKAMKGWLRSSREPSLLGRYSHRCLTPGEAFFCRSRRNPSETRPQAETTVTPLGP
jgi:hypothetical protein